MNAASGSALNALPAPFVAHGLGLTLRPWRASDAEPLTAMAQDPLLQTWNPIERGAEGAEAWIAKRAVWDDHMSWALADDDDAPVGGISLWLFDWTNASASIGYWTAPGQRRRGLASRGTRVAVAIAFRVTGIERVTLFHALENAESCRVAERAGFAYEGTLRRSWRYPDGALHDEHLHAVLRSDAGVLDALDG